MRALDPNAGRGELRLALESLRPRLTRSSWFSLVAALLLLVPSWYMLEVYDRVVNSRSPMTLLMLTLLVLAVYAVMAMLEWAHRE
jgi:ATP-binding cassette, subfamily C, bacterial exporter for protease/lipase